MTDTPIFEKLALSTPDFVDKNTKKLAVLFPTYVVESRDKDTGKIKRSIDFDMLKGELSNDIAYDLTERYQMTWPGKAESLVEGHRPIDKTLRPAVDESVDFDNTENMFIEGDNLDALKLLQENYLGKVKMIYIDPPYNTGKDFVYNDNFKQKKADFDKDSDYTDEDGGRLVSNTESNGRFHSDWLSMMYPRLRLARNLLKDDGVIFISIDDNEQANLKKLCDEVFGEDNLIRIICHKSRASVSNDTIISSNHNFILLYAKNKRTVFATRTHFGLEPILEGFKLVDENGKYKLVPVTNPHPNIPYTFEGITGYWRFSEKTMTEKYNDGLVVKSGNGLYQKYYEEKAKNKRRIITSWWDEKFYTSEATKKLKIMMGGNYFDTPKPIELIVRMLKFTTNANDIILDFFAGSGTTAHAVMALNAEDGGNRRCISVQLAEETSEKSEAFKAGYKNIAEISKERIRRAGTKILTDNEESKDPKNLSNLDTGFRVLNIDSGNREDVKDLANDERQDGLFDKIGNIKEDRTAQDLLFGVMLDWGLDLALPITETIINGKQIFILRWIKRNKALHC